MTFLTGIALIAAGFVLLFAFACFAVGQQGEQDPTTIPPPPEPRTVTGRLPIVRTHDELDVLIAARHAKGDAARKGWQTRRAGQ